MPHPNQTPVVSNRRFVPNGCDLHPTTMYLCDCVIMYLCDCVIMYLCNYVFCIQTQCGCFVPNGCDLHPLTMYLCNYVFCIQTQCVCVLHHGCDQHPTTMYFDLQIGRVTHTWGIPTPWNISKKRVQFGPGQRYPVESLFVEMYFQLWCKTLPLHLSSDTSWCIWELLEDKCSLFRVLGIINTNTGTNTKWMHIRTLR